MKLATTTGDFERYCPRITERIRHIREAGFRFVDLSLYTVKGNEELLDCDDWRKNAAEIDAYMKENGVPVMGNVTMNLPYKSKYDIYDLVDKVLSYVKLP